MFVEESVEMARERQATIPDASKLIEAARLLASGCEVVLAFDRKGAVQSVATAPRRPQRMITTHRYAKCH